MPLMTALAPSAATANSLTANSISPATFRTLQKHVYSGTGIVIDSTKEYLLESRLNPIVQEMKLGSLEALCQLLDREPLGVASRMVVDSITTNETLFFRDIATFNALRDAVLPELVKNVGSRRLRIWSAAASSGQEVYSIAMTLLEMGLSGRDVEIHATDLSEKILEKARGGKYVQFEVNRGLPTPLLARYFTRAGLAWRVRDDVRDMVRFDKHDLRRPYRNGTFDLVLCRNVLIYFDASTKLQVLQHIVDTMQGGNILTLGCAENITSTTLPLQRTVINGSAFYTRNL